MHDPAAFIKKVSGSFDDPASDIRTAKAHSIVNARSLPARDATTEDRQAHEDLMSRVRRIVVQVTRHPDKAVKAKISSRFLNRVRSVGPDICGISYCNAVHEALNTYCNENPEAMPEDGA